MPYTAVAIEKENHPVMVHTLRTNALAQELIKRNLVPGLEGTRIIRREVNLGKSRFDFLLQKGKKEIILEVKSCTLFGQKMAMFPDAVTTRGKRHIEELALLTEGGKECAVLFLIFWPRAEFFMPEYHTDLAFAQTLLTARNKIAIMPLSVELGANFSLTSRVRLLEVPWKIVEKEAQDRGNYILILFLPEETNLEVGRLGVRKFPRGYYLYIGSARKNLSQRLERHRRLGKKQFWHIDTFRSIAQWHMALPIRTSQDLECTLARAVRRIAEWEIPAFGSSDCGCISHLYGMEEDPLHLPSFIALLQYFRMDRLVPNRPGSSGT